MPGFCRSVTNALALVAKHPEQVRTLVAHEPPAAQELPDHEAVLAVCEAIKETYLRDQCREVKGRARVSRMYQLPTC